MSDFCKIYAMNIERRASLLGLLELTSNDHKIAVILHNTLLDNNIERLVDDFYAYLLKHSEYIELLEPKLIPALKKTQSNYLRSLGINFDTSQYFNYRLQVGLAHKRVGLTLSLYQCAYHELQRLMMNLIPDGFIQDGISGRDIAGFIHKITSLDMALAMETYHQARVTDIQEKLDNAHVHEEELNEQIITDPLTGLFTREYGVDKVNNHLSRDKVNKGLYLIMADIDYFKAVNDTYGHLAGDEVLRKTAELLKSAVRDFDTVCRFGGEEFLIVLFRTTEDIAMKVAERIRQFVKANVVRHEGLEINVTISQGIASADMESDSMQLLKKADTALYEAKQQGRDCVVMSGADVIRN